MGGSQSDANVRPPADELITRIVDYVRDYTPSEEALTTARLCLMDSIGCGLMALHFEACTRHLGPIVAGAEVPDGARVLGTSHQLDPVKAAFDNGALVRWLDFNDTWLAAEWGHPSDNLAAIWSVADYRCRQGSAQFTVRDLLLAMVKAHEIQGVLALRNSLNRVGLDHVAYVKLASTALAAHLLGANREQMIAAVSHACVDGQSLRTYRHAPNTGSRKSWAAGDAASRGVRLAMLALAGEAEIPTALSAKTWGFYDALFDGNAFVMPQDFASYVMENVLFKVSYPAEFHAQTAVECAIKLHPQVINRLDDIERIDIETQESAVRIISKVGPLYNPADRDHCIQYMTAIGLLFGDLKALHYENDVATDPRIDALREKMEVAEDTRFSMDYLDPEKRSIANAITVLYKNGERSERVEIEYPLGHRQRRQESLPHLQKKFADALESLYPADRKDAIIALFAEAAQLDATPVDQFSDYFVR